MTDPHSVHDPYEGQLIAGRYHVGRRIGAGGTAHVYSAVQEPIGREVAVKILRSDLQGTEAAQIAERLLREAQLIARLSHPSIVTVHDCGILPNGAVYLVMERVKGVSLSSLLVGPLEPHRAVRLAAGVARALRHAHANGVVHRDVKPSNVLITIGDDGEETPKLLDFGIGKGMAEDAQTTVVGRFVGTPQYASPEQAEGLGTVDQRADLYSLGCMMYRMLTGVLPYEADTALGVAFKQVHAPWPPMATRSATPVDAQLEDIVRRAMEKRPEDRWPDADAMLTALETWERGQPSAAAGIGQVELPPEEEMSGAMTLVGPPPPPASRISIAPEPAVVAPVRPPPVVVTEPEPKRSSGVGWLLLGLLAFSFLGVVGLGVGGWWWTHRNPVEVTPPENPPVDPATVTPVASTETPPTSGTPPETPPTSGTPPQTPDQTPAEDPPKTAPNTTAVPPSTPPKTTPHSTKAPETGVTPPKTTPPKTSSGHYSEPIYIDSLLVQPDDANRALKWINSADEASLRASGIYARGVNLILQKRPFATLEAFAATPYIGTKSVEAAIKASH